MKRTKNVRYIICTPIRTVLTKRRLIACYGIVDHKSKSPEIVDDGMQNRLISGEIPLRQMNTKVNIYCTHIRMETKHFPFQELNRVVVLTMARALQVNGLDQQSVTWVKDTLNGIMQKTPHR